MKKYFSCCVDKPSHQKVKSTIPTRTRDALKNATQGVSRINSNNSLLEGQSSYSPEHIKDNFEEICKLIDKSDFSDKEDTKETETKPTASTITLRETFSYIRNDTLLVPQLYLGRQTSHQAETLKKSDTMSDVFCTKLQENYPEVFSETNLGQEFSQVDDIPECLKNEYEKGLMINQDYILTLIEKLQDTDEDEQWEIYEKDTSKCTCWLAKSGSFLTSKLPLLHCEFNFTNKIPFGRIIEAVTEIDHRSQWDKEIVKMYENKIFQDSCIIYTKYKKYRLVGNMDSVDKHLFFEVENEKGTPMFVSYTSFLPNGLVPKVKGHNRLKIVYSIMIFERLEDGSTCMQNYCQFDAGPRLRIQNCSSQILEFLMQKPRNWEKKLNNYLKRYSKRRRLG
ncbi:unnamed protein product [Moneuplotes crassus]|uniref:START domain-containing protein n=1 Tax=Euplotes crassus TaxID=5936 RepID=A0AAD1UPD8_EUPCR|nr:unnamed protein product [Moneuplotes crassus]